MSQRLKDKSKGRPGVQEQELSCGVTSIIQPITASFYSFRVLHTSSLLPVRMEKTPSLAHVCHQSLIPSAFSTSVFNPLFLFPYQSISSPLLTAAIHSAKQPLLHLHDRAGEENTHTHIGWSKYTTSSQFQYKGNCFSLGIPSNKATLNNIFFF